MATRQDILKRLRQVTDPELGADIVSLGLVYEVVPEPPAVLVRMTMTTPACPLEDYFRQTISRALKELPGITTVNIDLVFEPPWTPARIAPAVRTQLGIR